MTHGSLFSGIGGFDLAAQWMGWENKFHCEINEFCNQVLKYYWPNAERYTDIQSADFSIWRHRIDILSGGFPCQPYSAAGKRKGKEDDRHLWPEMLKAIRTVQPRWVVGENVYGIVNWSGGLVFDEVQSDLENEGYQVTPYILPACAVDAPHKRDRVWFVAHSNQRSRPEHELSAGRQGIESGVEGTGIIGNTEQQGLEGRGGQWEGFEQGRKEHDVTNAQAIGVEGNRTAGQQVAQVPAGKGLSGRDDAGNNWHNWPTQPPLRSRNDGIPSGLAGITFSKHRNESIKAYGNSVVPQIVYQIFKAIEQYENL